MPKKKKNERDSDKRPSRHSAVTAEVSEWEDLFAPLQRTSERPPQIPGFHAINDAELIHEESGMIMLDSSKLSEISLEDDSWGMRLA